MTSNNADDPWDWGVDRLFQELYTWPNPDGFLKPDPVALQNTLKEQNVTGAVFLMSIDKAAVRKDLAVQGLNQRTFVLAAISYFKLKSKKWLAMNPHVQPARSFPPSNSLGGFQGSSTDAAASVVDLAHRQLLAEAAVGAKAFGTPIRTPSDDLFVNKEQPDFEESTAKRRKLDVADPSAEQAPQFEDDDQGSKFSIYTSQGPIINDPAINPGVDQSTPKAEQNQVAGSNLPDSPVKPKRRLNLAELTTEPLPENVVRNRHDPSAADFVAHLLGPTPLEGFLSIYDQIGGEETALEGILPAYHQIGNQQVDDAQRRLAPIIIDTDIDEYRNKEVAAYYSCFQRDRVNQVAEDNLAHDSDADAAMQLHLENSSQPTDSQSHVEGISVNAYTTKSNRSRDSLQRVVAYLGKGKLPVDDVFYEGIKFGQELNVEDMTKDDYEISLHMGSAKPPGLVRYVNKLMRNFLLSKAAVTRESRATVTLISKINKGNQPVTQNLTRVSKIIRPAKFTDSLLAVDIRRNGQVFTAVRTYYEGDDAKSGLMGFFQTPSFTLYYHNSKGKCRARREKVVDWPQLLGDKSVDEFKSLDPFQVMSMRPEPQGADPDFLAKKWGGAADDTELPLFGESGSEDDFEEDPVFWREWEQEQGHVLPIVHQRSKKRSVITAEEVNAAIDEAITNLITNWQDKQQPKIEKTAYRIWRKSHNHGTEWEDVEAFEERIGYLQSRLSKLREEFHTLPWSRYSEVVGKAYVMEPTVFEREYLRWKIAVLKQDDVPDKPMKQAKSASATVMESGAVDNNQKKNSLDDDSDGLGDFVVSDDEDEVDVPEHSSVASDDDDDEAGFIGSGTPRSVKSLLEDQSEQDALANDQPKPVSATSQVESSHSEQDQPSDKELDPNLDELFTTASKFSTPRKSTKSDAKPNAFIDLTADSPPKQSDSSSGVLIDLCTPEKPASMSPVRSIPKIKMKPLRSPSPGPVKSAIYGELPPDVDPAVISQFSYGFYEALGDRERLLVRIFHKMKQHDRDRQLEFFAHFSDVKLWAMMKSTIQEHLKSEGSVQGDPNREGFDRLTILVQIFLMFIACKFFPWNDEPLPDASLHGALHNKEKHYPRFFQIGCQVYRYFNDSFRALQPASPSPEISRSSTVGLIVSDDDSDDDSDEGPIKRQTRRPRRSREITINTTTDDDVQAEDSLPLKRKKTILEDAGARSLRERNRERLAEQERRRQTLKAKLAQYGSSLDRGVEFYQINDAAAEGQKPIFVHEDFRRCIKPHQMNGVRFMWNQIVTTDGEENMQGCLLAHTMGLGKTMQTICLLVAIAEAAASPDESISSQIPDSLKQTKALILCPAGLIDNWMDELLGWTPPDILGNLWKLNSFDISERLDAISEWHEAGGVLLCSYDGFRNMLTNSAGKKQGARLTQEEHMRVQDQLLNGPNIVIADEAHKMKNTSSKLTKVATQFRTLSRIALTGSPLANNVGEYYAMINWIVHNYLGSLKEFDRKYKNPIEAGLFVESTQPERRTCLKKLKQLNEELRLKVDRAGMQVLKNELPPKVEFVLTLPLTDIQRKVYSMYIETLNASRNQLTKDGEVKTTTLWSWIATLSLLCNHPYCFSTKIQERKGAPESDKDRGELSSARAPNDQDDTTVADVVNVPLADTGLSQSFVNEVMELFNSEDLHSVELSYKASILCQILDCAKAVGDKTLIFSSSIPTLNFLEQLCRTQGRPYKRLDGKTNILKRQAQTKEFNKGVDEVYLISTTAGGLGLNLQSANRVVIFDFKFNPIQEEQAVGRAYRIGQLKPTFVYRFVCGGTFEDNIHNKTIFKAQLASRVVDKKSPLVAARKSLGEFLHEPKEVPQKDISHVRGLDPVLDKVLDLNPGIIRKIVQTDSFEIDDDDRLTAEENKEVLEQIRSDQLQRLQMMPVEIPAPVLAVQQSPRVSHITPTLPQRARFTPPQRPPFENSTSGRAGPAASHYFEGYAPIMGGFTRRE
ncbi:uncharacterized protein L3040_007232 [Drepanopeziza brunnea f. sp. 'multigermtubi']|uniref:SNF2 family helicase/ATPase n=1 Tax=Marssonina brunnea f. sp. multigermtubi (strain MB_m1) TaxID=1072389 RepID=K1Y1W5_MARBU|nr:SNF2 family helicase/ATPase [Drepanopeziza brunnea f. sp. 'multigermtubi' MB_m1]EKD19119.1 SNF2 family helicase/ATPase [Drepanopeziza brunnea f. sp. 'multigermtubi' MB_m1]KAJ5038368.1 hypothetical protein L3040_007232 [Drepanopeziza brunnea f. sp. 'multigermtubi']